MQSDTNIFQLIKGRLNANDAALRRFLSGIGILLVIAALLEVFVFNINFFKSLGYEEIDLSSQMNLPRDSQGFYRLTEPEHTIELHGLDTEIHNIHLDFDSNQPAQLLDFQIVFTDEAHKSFFGSTEYTVGVPVVAISTAVPESEYVHLSASGKVDSLTIDLVSEDVSYPVKIKSLSINVPEPFNFSLLRFGVVCAIFLLVYLFRPNSPLYKISLTERPVFTKRAIIAVVIVEVYLVSSFLIFGSNLVGISTKTYNYGEWDEASIVNVYDAAGDNAQQYSMLAEALSKGQLYLDEEPPEWLQTMDDPYDKGARDQMEKITGESYLFDVAYYEGHYYVYFGVVPEVLFYLPFYVLTGLDFPTAIGVLIAMIAFVLGCTALLDRLARYHFRRVNLGVFLILQGALVLCCGMLYLVKFPTFYSLPVMCGLAFSVWGLYCWVHGRTSERPFGWYLVGSLCMALVVGCRPQMVLLSFLAFPIFWRQFITEKFLFTKQGALQFACLLAPYVLVVGSLLAYNFARFGSLFDFGANYNLTVHNMPKRGLALGRIAPALFAYFLQPPAMDGTFPFLLPAPFDTTYMGETVREVTFGGIFPCLPVLWIIAFAYPILKMRNQACSIKTIAGVVMVLLVTGFLVAVVDAEMAGILQRYYADFSFMFLAAAVLLVLILNENLRENSRALRIFHEGLSLTVALSVLYVVLLCAVVETGWYGDVYDWAYHSLFETMQFWT